MNAASEALDIDLQAAPRTRGNALLEDLDRLRESDPVHWSERSQCWVLTRYQDVSDLFAGKLPLRHTGRIEAFSFSVVAEAQRARHIPVLQKYVPQWIVNLDGERHARIRLLLMKAFTHRIVESVRQFARQQAGQLLDLARANGEIEFNEQIARVLTGRVLFKLIGLPEEAFPELKNWAIAIVEGLGSGSPSLDLLRRADRAAAEMNRTVLAELEQRRANPREDLMTSMLQATEDSNRLSTDELLAQMQIIIVAGHDTTANTMTLGLEALSRHPDAWRYMYEHPGEMPKCVAELQRYAAMSGGQALIAAEDFELAGKHIRRGEIVVGFIAAADRDPRQFADPQRLDFTRNNRDSLVFAPGPHFCLGHVLARMQLAEFFAALVERFEGVELLDRELDFMPVFTFRGLYQLNVRFQSRRAGR